MSPAFFNRKLKNNFLCKICKKKSEKQELGKGFRMVEVAKIIKSG